MALISRISLVAIFGFIFCGLNAQERYFDERYIYTQNYINPYLTNVGATGFSSYQQILVNYRNKWSDFNGSPKTITLSYNGPVADRLGMGAGFMQDTYGSLRTSKGFISFSYMIESPTNKVSFGLSGEYIQHGLSSGIFNNGNTEPGDNTIIARLDGTQFFDASFGVYGLYDKKISYGLSIPSIVSSRLDESESNADRSFGFIFNLGYRMKSLSSGISFEPSLWVKKLNLVPTHIDINGKFGFLDDKFTGGLSYTIGADKRLGFLLGVNIDAINFYYSYNVSSLEFQDYNNGSHELMMVLNLGEKKSKEFIMDPK